MSFEIENIINDFAKNISEEIALKRFHEMDEVKAIATTRLSFALTELLNIQTHFLEDQIAATKKRYNTPGIDGDIKFKIGIELSKLNHTLKKHKRAVSNCQDYNQYQKLKIFIKNRYGSEVLQDFFNSI